MKPNCLRFLEHSAFVGATAVLVMGCESHVGFRCDIHGRFVRKDTGVAINERRVPELSLARNTKDSPSCGALGAMDFRQRLSTDREVYGSDGFLIRRMDGHVPTGRFTGHLFLPCDSDLVAEEGSLADEVVNMVPIPITISARIGECVGELGDVLLDVRPRRQ